MVYAFFVLMPLPPPTSTLFPSRRSSDLRLVEPCEDLVLLHLVGLEARRHLEGLDRVVRVGRSEEHTSELQSRPHLVCRLLLEKKNGPAMQSTFVAGPHLQAPFPTPLCPL